MNVILHEPEIPSNTGNIGRTCCATGTSLHLIKPLGFSLSEKALKRAGMDYWDKLDVHVYTDFEDFLEMVEIGSGAERPVESIKLSRYACYLIVQNADPSKKHHR